METIGSNITQENRGIITQVPESQSAGLGDGTVGRGAVSILQGTVSGAGGQRGRRSPQTGRAEPPAARPPDQRAVEQPLAMWSSAI